MFIMTYQGYFHFYYFFIKEVLKNAIQEYLKITLILPIICTQFMQNFKGFFFFSPMVT